MAYNVFHLRTAAIVFILTIVPWLFTSGQAKAAGERLNHVRVPSVTAGNPVEVFVDVEGGAALPANGRVFYRAAGENVFIHSELNVLQRRLEGHIPAVAVVAPEVQYYFEVHLSDGQTLLFPTGAPHEQPPVSLPVNPGMTSPLTAGGIIILSPEPGAVVVGRQAVIAVSFSADRQIRDPSKIHITLDGVDVTSRAIRSEGIISYPAEKLAAGRHSVLVEDLSALKPRRLASWSFTTRIAGLTGGGVPLKARVVTGYSYEDISERKRDITFFDARLWGERGELEWFTRAYITNLEKPEIQPQNRFLASVQYRALALRVGDTRPQFSEFTLWDQVTRGAEFQLNSSIFKLGVAWGQLRRELEGVGNWQLNPTGTDSSRAVIRPGTYSRTALAVRPGIPISRTTTLSFNILKVKDDVNSIDWGIKPKDNLVVGADVRYESPTRRVIFTTETAASLYNSDISGGAMQDAKDLESIIVVNQFFDPLPADSTILKKGIAPAELANKLFAEIAKSSLAHRTTLTINFARNELRLGYKLIGGSFRSLGSPSVLNDVAGYSVQDRLRLLDSRLYLTVGYEAYSDNVNGRAKTTTSRNIVQAGIAYYSPPRYPNVNFGVRLYDRLNNATLETRRLSNGDSVVVDRRVDNLSSTYNFGIDQNFAFGGMNHTAALFFNTTGSDDAIHHDLNTSLGSWNLNLSSRLGMLLETGLAFSRSEQKSLNGRDQNTFTTTALNARWTLMPAKMWLFGGVSLTGSEGGNDEVTALTDSTQADAMVKQRKLDLTRLEFSLGMDYRISDQHQVNVSASQANQTDDGFVRFHSGRTVFNSGTAITQDDFAVRLRYTYSF